jgi:hypothetical protein
MFIGRTLKTLHVSSMTFMLHFRYDAAGIGAWRSRNSFPLFVCQIPIRVSAGGFSRMILFRCSTENSPNRNLVVAESRRKSGDDSADSLLSPVSSSFSFSSSSSNRSLEPDEK